MRYRGWIAVLVVFAFVALSGVVYRTATYREQLTLPEHLVYEVFAPLQRLTNGVVGAVRSSIESVATLRSAQKENEALRLELDALRTERDALLEAGRQNARLRELLELSQGRTEELAVAEVIARSPNNWLGSITIDKGRIHGVEPGMAVVAAEGAVGKIRNVTQTTAEVVLITDSRSSIGGRVRETGHLVLVEGTGDPTAEKATVRLLDWEATLRPGDVVVASELSWSFPKGLPIGVVEEVDERGTGLTPLGTLRPFVDLERLEWVVILKAETLEAPWWEEPS